MDLASVKLEYKNRLESFLNNARKKYLAHPKSSAARIDKLCAISHVKYGNPVQQNKDGINVVICGSQNSIGSDIKITAIRFVAECVVGESLYYWHLGVEPLDGNYNNVTFENVEFVKTDRNCADEHQEIDFSGLKTVGRNWYENKFTKID